MAHPGAPLNTGLGTCPKLDYRDSNKKMWVSGCRSAVQQVTSVSRCIMDGISFEFNDIISLYKKNDSERKWYVSLGIRHIIYYYLWY